MLRLLVRLIVVLVFISGGLYLWKHHSRKPPSAAEEEAQETESTTPEAKQPEGFVTLAGPLAKYVTGAKSAGQDSDDDTPRSRKFYRQDHIEDSPVGTSTHIVHKTFPVVRAVHVPFEIPPHAVTPKFHGTFCSFSQQGGIPTNDESANVDLLLMNEEQYTAFAAGKDPDVLLIADTSHYQDINFDLSPSRDQPVKYHLVFRNTPGGAAKKLVQADFSVDF
jgi:hypothetical protein